MLWLGRISHMCVVNYLYFVTAVLPEDVKVQILKMVPDQACEFCVACKVTIQVSSYHDASAVTAVNKSVNIS